MLLDEKIYAATFDQLNDPMEGAFLSNEVLSEEIKKCIKGAKLEKKIVSLVKKEDGKLPTNMLMWSHYSDEHRGCCIEFHFQNPEDEANVHDITYIEKIHAENAENQEEIDVNNILTRKFHDWAYENEVRYLGPKKFVPIQIDTIYLGMRTDNLYENDNKPNVTFFKDLISHLCPNVHVVIMKAEDFNEHHINTRWNRE
jgi:hypothetical protein